MHNIRYIKLVKRLVRRTKKTGDCFIWTGAITGAGYGSITVEDRSISTHRLAAYLFRNIPLNSDIQILHKSECTSRACWNPEHTYDGTPKNNVRDSVRAGTHSSGWSRR